MSLLIASFKETNQIGKNVAAQLKAQHEEIQVKQFPDGESCIRIEQNPQNKNFLIIQSFAKESNKKINETILAAETAREHRAKKIILVATYLPYMRQDKQFNSYESVSAKTIVKLLSNYFDKIIAIDPHLHRIHSLKEISKNAKEITANNLISEYIKNNFSSDFQIVGPDKESFQWAKTIAKLSGKEAIILSKKRLSSTNVKIESTNLDKNLIIIDDIISTGNTILETIKIAKKQGAKKIIVIGVHALLLGNTASLITKHAELITTNTVPNKFAKIDVSSLIASAIKQFYG